ncbi:helix-turn-helix domain-containing protein [Tsukamurella tyrosinosolvens]|uniref:helix-turn-helix domain-containing protein n=1 Tax=Tsukamurella tyrosinosolvens TaxID=57704 RepID=UPI002DD41FE0|nr:helix-turn-helix domain-containing protein [Tsukamurella tyrosinosolvens]MEC4613180.1 helix-turn-helix domain-containing protein [Tsukamurella tyrosinosolvens]
METFTPPTLWCGMMMRMAARSTGPRTELKRVREQLGVKQRAVARQLLRERQLPDLSESAVDVMRQTLSHWENARRPVPPADQPRLAAILGVSLVDLGFAPPSLTVPAPDVRSLLAGSQRVTPDDIDRYAQQLENIRRNDRSFGALDQIDQLASQVKKGARWLSFTVLTKDRQQLARHVCDAATLAGWQSLDVGDTSRAWNFYDQARSAGHDADDDGVFVHALASRANVLHDCGDHRTALEIIDEAAASRQVPPLLAAWLHASRGEAHAKLGDRDTALRSFDEAARALPAEHVDERLPFIFLAPVHLERWRGHALATLGDPEAIPTLSSALERLDETFVRARTALHVDLAEVHHKLGDYDQSVHYAEAAIKDASTLGSQRNYTRAVKYRFGQPLRGTG